MKKLVLFLLVLVSFIALVGCNIASSDNNDSSNDNNTGENSQGNENNNGENNQGNENNPGENNQGNEQNQNNDEITYLTVSEALEMALQAGDVGTSEKKYVKGTIKNITNSNYGEMYITDGKSDLYVYGVYSSDGALRYNELEQKPFSGDEVYLYGQLKTYNNSPELGASWLQKFVSHQDELSFDDYQDATILEAREAEVNSKVTIEGIVAKITYANGMVPNGIYLVDNTGSIYVYGLELAGRVEVGQKVKVAGTKTLYILDSEKSYAATFGYQGSIQLQDASFVSASTEKYDFDKSWIQDSTIKQMLETPMSDNITTNIFKVRAIINKVPGSGFVNYYIDDLDNKTGSYCYSLCNGSDYSYLDEFDGKICTVYLSALNCKATKSGTVYRFVPIAVEEITDFSMSANEIAKFALEYYAKDQFLAEYNSNPDALLLAYASNSLIPFDDVRLTYSCGSKLVTFEEYQDGVIMSIQDGNAETTIDIKASYGGVEEQISVKISIKSKEAISSISIAEAIAKDDNSVVTVRGIVMSGLVVQNGFYLNDGTGVIAIRCDSETISKINIGDEVIMTGTKKHVLKQPSSTMLGQLCIDNATLELNLYGNKQYDTSLFITDKTFADIIDLIPQVNEDLTCNVYVVKCYLTKYVAAYYTNYNISNEDGSNWITLYAASKTQYEFLDPLVDKGEVTVTFMLCNWNDKNPYKGCIISATDGEITVVNTNSFK